MNKNFFNKKGSEPINYFWNLSGINIIGFKYTINFLTKFLTYLFIINFIVIILKTFVSFTINNIIIFNIILSIIYFTFILIYTKYIINIKNNNINNYYYKNEISIAYILINILTFIYIYLNFNTIYNSNNLILDNIAIMMIIITIIITPICICSLRHNNIKNYSTYIITFLILEILVILSVITKNILLFYIFFELITIIMYFIISKDGSGKLKYKAANYLLIYTGTGSFFILNGICLCFLKTGSINIIEIQNFNFTLIDQKILFFFFFIGFLIKTPVYPLSKWLPLAHVESPTGISIFLAAIILKYSTFGFIWFILPISPLIIKKYLIFILTFFILSGIIATFLTLIQTDLKRIIAFSSITHMSFNNFGLFSLSEEGYLSALYSTIGHAIVSGSLFYAIGCLYNIAHKWEIDSYSGLIKNVSLLSFFLIFFNFANIGFPLTINFIPETLFLLALIKRSIILFILYFFSYFATIIYSIWTINRILSGSLRFPKTYNIQSNYKKIMSNFNIDKIILYFLSINIVIFGIFPNIFLNIFKLEYYNLIIQIISKNI